MRSTITRLVVAAFTALALVPATASAHDSGSWEHKNHYLRSKMIRLGGDPGCDLVARKCDKRPTGKRVRRYFGVMRAAILPRSAVRHVRYGRPDQAPAGGETLHAGPGLEAIAQCESGGDPSTNTGNGFYGKYQFTWSTWVSVGGTGNPAAASEAEQDKRAAILLSQQGTSPWPVCGN